MALALGGIGWCGRLTLAALVLAPSVAGAADCASLFRFDQRARLGVPEIAQVTTHASASAGGDIWLMGDGFRAEGRPEREGWSALAVIGVSAGLGGPFVGGVLWTQKPEMFSDEAMTATGANGRAVMRVRPKTAVAACPNGWSIEVLANGVVRVNGARVGSVA